MTTRRRNRLMMTGLPGIGAACLFFVSGCGGQPPANDGQVVATAPAARETSLKAIAAGLGRSDLKSLAAITEALNTKPSGGLKSLGEAEAAEWVEVLAGLRAGYRGYTSAGQRAAVVGSVGPIFEKFAVEPAPDSWLKALSPTRDLLSSGLTDPESEVRASAMGSLGKLWEWYPGRTMLPVEETTLAEWKDLFHAPVVRKLADRDPRTRAAAVSCLAKAPIDALAAPAVAYVDDPQSGAVRSQVLISFGRRPNLLTDDMLLKRLHDPEPGIPQTAELILKARGLSKDQVALGKLITSPRAEMRASVIPLLKDRDDLDPVVWLLRLSHDPNEIVRARAVEAMQGKDSPEVRARIREMATQDASESVRAAANKLVAESPRPETTVALPPLPGSPSLTPRAN